MSHLFKNPRKRNILILSIIFLAGFFLRFRYISGAEFPLNDGGLFYQMTRELIRNNFKLPEFSTYNLNDIPFAYPPLGFYVTGLISQTLNVDLLQVFIWFPFISNLLAIPVVYLLTKSLLKKDSSALLATALWTVCLPSFKWLIMGGGVTRSIAYTASFASLYFFVTYLENSKKKNLIYAILLGGITGLSHLEIFWVLCISLFALWFYNKQTPLKRAIRDLAIYYLGCILVISPYLITVFSKHGVSPFLAGFGTGGFDMIKQVFNLILFNFTEEYVFTVIAALALIGLFYRVTQRQYCFVTWFFVILFLDPRSVNRSILIVVSILAAVAIEEIIIPALRNGAGTEHTFGHQLDCKQIKSKITDGKKQHILLVSAFFVFQLFLLAYFQYYDEISPTQKISQNELAAFKWITQNTKPDNTFLVLTSSLNWETDQISEWFPALTNRKSVSTVQGSEWIPRNGHKLSGDFYDNINSCLKDSFSCVENVLLEEEVEVDYYFFSINTCVAESAICPNLILENALSSNIYQVVYRNPEVVILSYNPEN